MKERQICKDKCDRIKQNIRSNRVKFTKNVEEFGEDNELNEDPDDDVDEENKGSSSKQSRNSVAPPAQGSSGPGRDQSSRQSVISTMQLNQVSPHAVVCQGYEYHLANTRIDYTFKDEEIAFLVSQKSQIDREIQTLAAEMAEINPNVQILEVYKEKRREFLKK